MIGAEQQLLVPPGDTVNVNNYCYVEPNQVIIDTHSEYWRQYDVNPPPLTVNSKGVRFYIYELMHLYGPLFREGFQHPPFHTVTLALNKLSWSSEAEDTRSIQITDFLYMRLTEQGAERVKRVFANRFASRNVGDLTTMQFHTIAYLFGPDCHMGADFQHIKDNTLYLPKL
jgi:hypothetical protein